MRIGVIGPRPPLRGGIAAHTVTLEQALMERGHELVRVGFSRLYPPGLFPGRSETLPNTDPAAIDDSCDVCADALDPRTWSAASRAITNSHCDRLIFQWWHPFFSRALSRMTSDARVPIIAVCHNARPHEVYPGWRRATVRALGGADLLVCHSQAVSDELGRLLPPVARRVAAMPVLVPAAARIGRGEARTRLGLREHARLALFAGHARRYKGTDVLLAAWDRARLPTMSGLVLAGESYLGAGKLEAAVGRCRRRASVRVIDRYLPDDELAAWLAAADVLVLPYSRASQSGLLSSAAAAGVQVIASRVGGLADQARAVGAILVEPGSVEELACALSQALGRDSAADALRHDVSSHMRSSPASTAEELAIACELPLRCE